MNRLQTLAKTPLVRLARFDHPSEAPHRDPQEEINTHYSVNFVERGGFTLRTRRKSLDLGSGMVFITQPGLAYCCWHAEPTPSDVCLSVIYAEERAEECSRAAQSRSSCSPLPCILPHANRLAYLRLRLLRTATNGSENLAVEAAAGELLAAVADQRSGKLYGEHQLAWYAERVEAARFLLDTQYTEPHALASLGRAVGISPFHFARVFRELTGTPPHRYLLRVRLARAAQQLRQGASVTETCYACGFNSLSHFIRLFRRAFGTPPSRFAA